MTSLRHRLGVGPSAVKTIYSQVQVERTDTKTAVTTPFGLFEFLRMFFGLSNVAQTLQRFNLEVARRLANKYIHLVDILVASHSDEH